MRKHRLSIVLLTLVLLTGLGPGSLAAGPTGDIATVRTQLVAWYARRAPDAETIGGYVRNLRSEGAWPDVDYASTERGGWPTYRHLSRMLAMAEAYRKPDHPLADDDALQIAILKSLEHWVEKGYVNPNWWYPQIGVPMTLAPILILMEDAVGPDLKDKAMSQVLARSTMGMTGQNKVWLAGIAFMKGLLNNDRDLMAEAREQIFSELRVTTAEGIQPDYSFHQHGPQLQWGNYGAAFGSDMIRWANILRGTDYALNPRQIDVLRNYLLEGQSWILWKGRMDISGCGRQIFRNCQGSKGNGMLGQFKLMAALDPEKANAYARVIAANQPDAGEVLAGNKHFWRSDITVHRRETWYASVKMSSKRVTGAETCNSENMLGLHLGDGVTYFHQTGREYDDLFPVWDWRRLPGTTCRQDQRLLVPTSKACRGLSDFVGGVSDCECGLAAMEYLRDGLRARKVWFFLDEAVVCLGADIECTQLESVWTSVNQCLLNGPVTISMSQRARRLAQGQSLCDELEWAHHDGIGYAFLEPGAVSVCAQEQAGNWHRVHRRESKETVRRNVFSLGIDHGSRPKGARYAYAVLPGVAADEMPSLCDSLPVEILHQSSSLQAISSEDGKRVQAAFFEPGRLARGAGRFIEVDTPCLVMLDETGSRARLTVADPTGLQQRIGVVLSGRYTGPRTRYDPTKGQTELTITLPQEGFAGRTVRVALR